MLKISVTFSALVEVSVTLSPLAENKKNKKKKRLFLFALIFFGPTKIKGVTKASLLLVNVKIANDKTWGRDQHLMQETWGVTENPPSAEHGKVAEAHYSQLPPKF